MDYKEHIEKAIDYIENNLKYELDVEACANACGYSRYHFLRAFYKVTGLTPADYIRKRRLSEIAKRICGNEQYISQIAFEWGFNSKENFVRAFKGEHHILPTEYKSAENSLKLYERITFEIPLISVTPKIITLDSFSLVTYKSDEDYAPNFWNKYNAKGISKILSGGKSVMDFGVCVWNTDENKLDYYIGIKKDDAQGDTTNAIPLTINGGLYAVFTTPKATHADFVNTIHNTWHFILNEWFPESDFKVRCGCQFECYVEESRTYSEDIYIPIERK